MSPQEMPGARQRAPRFFPIPQKKNPFFFGKSPPPPKKKYKQVDRSVGSAPAQSLFPCRLFFLFDFYREFFLNECFRDQANLEPILATQ